VENVEMAIKESFQDRKATYPKGGFRIVREASLVPGKDRGWLSEKKQT